MTEPRFRHEMATTWWISAAACIGWDPELFFPVGSSGPALEQIAEAKAVCTTCPVRDDCLEWSLATFQDAGVWGGLDEEERRTIRRARRRALLAAEADRGEELAATG